MRRTICRKTVSWLLTLTMVLAFIPTVGITAMATEDENPATIYEVENDAQETPGNVTDGAIDNQDEPQEEPQDEPQNEPANEEQGEGENEGFPGVMLMRGLFLQSTPSGEEIVENQEPVGLPTPAFSVEAGTYTEAQSIEITCDAGTAPVSIYYTLDDTEPTADSLWYRSALQLSENTTVKAIAMAEGYLSSAVATAAYVFNIPPVASIGNDGYPFGASMSSSQITLKVAIESGTAESYQWQKATSRATEPADSAFTDIAGATSADYTFAPEDGAWYRCVVNTKYKSEAVQAIMPNTSSDKFGRTWTRPVSGNAWYLSNGTMAYTINGSTFDASGLFEKGGKKYMLQTSYGGGGWRMVTSTNANGSNNSSASLDAIYFAFGDDAYALYITADLANGQQAFSFGCDTMIGNSYTSGSYSDRAALIAKLNDDHSLKHVAMIGAASEKAAVESDPAFVIKPVTGAPSFWLSGYSSRQHFGFASGYTTGTVYADGLGTKTGTVKVEGIDSGMTMSWMNVTSGGQVEFMFSVGDVAATGAVKAGIDYQREVISGLENSKDYIITIVNEDGTDGEAFEIRSNSRGEAELAGQSNDDPSKPYDFTGKTIKIAKKNSNDQPKVETVAARPNVSSLNNTTETADRPINVRGNEITAAPHSITIQLDKRDSQKMNQEYRLVDENGNQVKAWARPDNNGKVVFDGLDPNTQYTVETRIPATAAAPASLPSPADVRTASEAEINVPSGNEATAPADGTEHSFPIEVTGGNNPQVTYSTSLTAEYSEDVPSFKAGGNYTVYYRITQDGSDPVYGSYNVTINPKMTFNLNGGNALTLGGIGGYVTAAGDNAVTVAYGQSPRTLVTEATKDTAPSFFAGWYSDARLKNLYWFEQDFANAPAVLSDMNLYARWAQRLSTVNGQTLDAVTKLQLQKGGVPVPSNDWVDVVNGTFNISGVPDDEYDLVLKKMNNGKEQTITARVRVEDDQIYFIDGNIDFPLNNISSKVTVEAGAPAVVVSGFEKETLNVEQWAFTGGESNPYAILELKFNNSEDITHISQEDADNHLTADEQAVHTAQTAITSEAGVGTQVEFFDISVIRTDYEDGAEPEVFTISNLQQAIEIAIPYTPENGQVISTVYRYHGGVAEAFTKLDARPAGSNEYVDGTFYVGDGVVYIYTDKFSTYAIGTTAQRGSSRAATFKNVVKETTNGTYKLSDNNPIANQLVTITPQPNEGYVVGKITVTDTKGNIVKLTDNGNGTYSFRQPDGAVTIDIQFVTEIVAALTVSYDVCTEGNDCPIWPFADAKSTEWYHNGVHWAIDNNIMKGYNETQFGPNDDTTRAQVATILYRLAGSPAATKENGFADVKADQWYTDAINWAAETGVVTGWTRYSDGAEVFDPNAPVTREQLAAMIYRFAKLNGKGFEGLWAFNLDYKDADSVSEWANEAVCWMTMQGVITGIGGDLIDPQADASRAQVATMFMRYCEDAAK